MLLALRGMPIEGVEEPRPVVTETRQALVDASLARRELMVLRGHEGRINAAAFSPDGARIVSGSWDGTVRVWDAASGAEQLVLRGHEEPVSAAAFLPDGARIVSGSDDQTVRVWDRVWFVGKDDAALVAHACGRLPRDLSPKAIERFNLDPDAPWPCAERAKTLWPHPMAARPPRRAQALRHRSEHGLALAVREGRFWLRLRPSELGLSTTGIRVILLSIPLE
jgi:WD domain, G-beta repeat